MENIVRFEKLHEGEYFPEHVAYSHIQMVCSHNLVSLYFPMSLQCGHLGTTSEWNGVDHLVHAGLYLYDSYKL